MTRRYRTPRRRFGRWREPSPVLLVTEDDRASLIVAFARLVWRYRSELAPFTTAAVLAIAAAWTHHGHPGWAVPIAALTVALSGSLAVPPGRWPVGRWASRWPVVGRSSERLYAASVVGLAGAWLAAATAYGPGDRPLPVVAMLGTVVAGIPWWAHRRRRKRVHVERTIAAWPQFADAIGLPGSRVLSAVVDRWGWSARLALRRGQSAGRAIEHADAIESALGVRPGAVRLEADARRADRVTLRVIEADPHADPIPLPVPAIGGNRSITDPIELGIFEDGTPVRIRFAYRHALIGGVVGAGKSGVVNVILASLVACRDVVVWGIDLKGGMELQPWASCLGRLATTPAEAVAMLRDAVARLENRAASLAARGERLWRPTPNDPAIVIVIDEYAELPDEASDYADSLARRSRAVAITLLAATQRPTQRAMGHNAVRSQMDIRICLRIRERRDGDLILGQGMAAAGWHPEVLNAPGKFLLSDPEHTAPRPARAYLIDDATVSATARANAASRPTSPDTPAVPDTDERPTGSTSPEEALRIALENAPEQGISVPELMKACGMSRPWVYRRLARLAARQVRPGYWRAGASGDR